MRLFGKSVRAWAGPLAASAAALSLGFGASAVQAADFGGDCCADLEERIAELESTTVRKGNRKVSLKVSGHVSQQVLFWDDGDQSDAYVTDNTNISTRFRFSGAARITSDWSAGYLIEIETIAANSAAVDQFDDDAFSGVRIRKTEWHIKSKTYGKLSVGQGSSATDDIILAATSGCYPACFSDVGLNGGGIFARRGDGVVTDQSQIGFLQGSLDTRRVNRVRYDTPTFAGFFVSAAWGEDDFWDVSLRYAGEVGQFKIVAMGGYLEDQDNQSILGDSEVSEIKGSASIMHVPTGLFVTGMGVHREFSDAGNADFDFWYVRGGIEQRWLGIGRTVIYGEYGTGDDGLVNSAAAATAFNLTQVTSSEMDVFGIGLVQHIDAAAMNMYFAYKNFEGDAAGLPGEAVGLNDVDVFFAGAMIKF